MEEIEKNDVRELLGNITDFKSELLSGNEEMENPDGKSVEKYFNIKLKNQLDAKQSYSNIKIVLSEFLEELRLYMFGKAFNDDKLDKKVAKKILAQYEEYFKDETEIEIDSFYPHIYGETILKFFKLIKNYSYPKVEGISPKLKYTVLVESTYCLKKNIIKKSDQLRKNFLFFSMLSKFYKQHKEYIEDFYEFFIRRHIFSDKSIKTIYDFKKDPSLDLSYFDNYIILFVSDSKYESFKEVKRTIDSSEPFNKDEIEFGLEKCFQIGLTSKLKGPKVEKVFSGEKEENKSDMSGSNDEKKNIQIKKEGKQKLLYSYRKFKYLIDNINEETNFKVILIYLDLYLNVLAPKTEIVDKLEYLNNKISTIGNELVDTKTKLNNTEEKLNNTEKKLNNTTEKLAETKRTVEMLVKYIQNKDPNFKMEELV